MSERLMFYKKTNSRLEQIKWLSNLEYEILTINPDEDHKRHGWNERSLKDIEDSLLSLDQMTDETYEEKKTEYWEYIYEDALADHMMDMAFLEEMSGIND
jgi:hypothetical protein